jgi:hypothetical protein
MAHIFGKECDNSFGLGLCGLVITLLDIGIKLFGSLLGHQLGLDFVVHSGREDSSKERVDWVLAQNAVELLN